MIPKVTSIFNLIWDMNKNKNSKYKKENEIVSEQNKRTSEHKGEQLCNVS